MSCLERCPECPSRLYPESKRKYVVPGDGPENARVVFVGEGPGLEENYRHRPFVGKTGQETNNTYFPLAGVSRPDVYVTNAFKCHWADSKDTPPQNVVNSCADFHLRRELERINPEWVVLMGWIWILIWCMGLPGRGSCWGGKGISSTSTTRLVACIRAAPCSSYWMGSGS
jgi:uracil-DNA glycosylase family 4